jgi:hypothetical protein
VTERPLAERLGSPGVSSEVQSRIVAGTLARLDAPPSRRWPMVVLALGAAAAAAALLVPARRPSPVVAIAHRAPAPLITPTPAEPAREVARSFVGPHTEELGRHRLVLAPGARAVSLPAGSNGEVSVRLEQGRAQFDVAHLERAERFLVLADPVEVTVVGTRFRVDRQGACSTVALQEGRVDVSFRGQMVAQLFPPDERLFCLTAAGLESTSPGEQEMRSAPGLIARDRDLPRAAELLERYRRGHPGGVFEAEALFHLVRLQVRLGQEGRAAVTLRELERRHADDPRLPDLHALVEGR